MGTVSPGPQKGASTRICINAVANEFLAGRSHRWLWLGLLKLWLNSRCASVLPAGRHLFHLEEVWGLGACPSLTTLIGEGASALFHMAAARGPPALPPCPLCCGAVPKPMLPQARVQRQSRVFQGGQRSEPLPSCRQAPAMGPGFCGEQLPGAGRSPGIRAGGSLQGEGGV